MYYMCVVCIMYVPRVWVMDGKCVFLLCMVWCVCGGVIYSVLCICVCVCVSFGTWVGVAFSAWVPSDSWDPDPTPHWPCAE